eukprot:TRINITY_DN10934_c0_g2_i2.p1 TRINITY_DN10934_c0_g2~~TRINITY_DN10934_c0_g2_i2.p1  ORF type:complete len:101 (-),score=15.74 TRINITY_DN10934_c0_g2_i2:189-491(-)
MRNDPKGEQQSRNYNDNLRVQTIRHAMVGMLEAPPAGMVEVVRAHFREKREHIAETVAGWAREAAEAGRKGTESKLRGLLDDFNRLVQGGLDSLDGGLDR